MNCLINSVRFPWLKFCLLPSTLAPFALSQICSGLSICRLLLMLLHFSKMTSPNFHRVDWSCLLLLFSHWVVSNSLRPHRLYPARFLYPWDFPGENTGVGCHFLLQGIFPTQTAKLDLLHGQVDSLPLNHQGYPSLSLGLNTKSWGTSK